MLTYFYTNHQKEVEEFKNNQKLQEPEPVSTQQEILVLEPPTVKPQVLKTPAIPQSEMLVAPQAPASQTTYDDTDKLLQAFLPIPTPQDKHVQEILITVKK